MYILIACMSFVDMCLPLILIPNLLLNVLFNASGISLSGCLVQMFFVHFSGTCQSTLLLWMALDRYFAICRPLSYHDHMSLPRFLRFVIPLLVRDVVMIVTVVILAGKVLYCFSNVINHCVCEHMALVELGCGSTAINSLVGLLAVFLVTVFDFLCITASYIIIFRSVLRSGKSSAKAVHTCVTHIIVIVISLTFALTASLSYRMNSLPNAGRVFVSSLTFVLTAFLSYRMNSLPNAGRVSVSILYLFLPSCINPIIYGVRTTEIRKHIWRTLSSRTL
uniref:G-protein coupled receptors family 1 profile domain-containing protein n=1 Tax=Xiphophorus maculatus TaxID=8083 RepID=A0A3B5QKT1_XIPMA